MLPRLSRSQLAEAMTYAVAFYLESGLVFAADSRTNAGVDDVSTYRKLTVFEKPGERLMTLLASGNLAVTQAITELLRQGNLRKKKNAANLMNAKDMFAAAQVVGEAVREIYRQDSEALREHNEEFRIGLIFGGQIKGGGPPRLFFIYAAGNFIEASPDSPYFQIGENKYGKPIIDRTITHQSTMVQATKACLLSFDSTMRSNISVGMPIDLLCYRKDSFKRGLTTRIDEKNAYFEAVRNYWGDALRFAFDEMPNPDWKI
jgi:putative proteasome-type protease